MKTLGEVLTLSVQHLKERHVPRARRMVEELLAHHLGAHQICGPHAVRSADESRPSCFALPRFAQTKIKGEFPRSTPGPNFFFHRQLRWVRRVIPRQETEILLGQGVPGVTPEMKVG